MLEAVLRHHFAGFQLDVAFTVPAGITALFGRSGAGKTTVAKAIAGLIRCDQALVRLEGRVLDDGGFHLPTHRREIGYVFQEPRLFPHLTVRQNLTYSRLFHRIPGTPLEDVVGLLGLEQLLTAAPCDLVRGRKGAGCDRARADVFPAPFAAGRALGRPGRDPQGRNPALA